MKNLFFTLLLLSAIISSSCSKDCPTDDLNGTYVEKLKNNTKVADTVFVKFNQKSKHISISDVEGWNSYVSFNGGKTESDPDGSFLAYRVYSFDKKCDGFKLTSTGHAFFTCNEEWSRFYEKLE
jgi:hypothetical protein